MNTKQTVNNFNEIDKKFLSYSVSLIYMNIRSLRLNFTPFITSINTIINFVKVIVLIETNITDNECSFYNIPGFNSVFLNREGRGGGIAVYVKENINYTQLAAQSTSFEHIQLDMVIRVGNFSSFQ